MSSNIITSDTAFGETEINNSMPLDDVVGNEGP